MASVSKDLVKVLNGVFGTENELSRQLITVIEKAGKMNNAEVEDILNDIYTHVQNGDFSTLDEMVGRFSVYPELEEDILTLRMLSCDFSNDNNEYTFALALASDKEKFIAKKICELVLNEEDAFDNDQQKQIHIKFMDDEFYQLDFSRNLLESLENNEIGEEEKQRIVHIKNLAESEFRKFSAMN